MELENYNAVATRCEMTGQARDNYEMSSRSASPPPRTVSASTHRISGKGRVVRSARLSALGRDTHDLSDRMRSQGVRPRPVTIGAAELGDDVATGAAVDLRLHRLGC